MTALPWPTPPQPKASLTALAISAAVLLGSAVAATATPARWQQEGWKTDFSRSAIDFGEILSGGPPKDGIPAIDAPRFESVEKIADLADTAPVISLAIDGVARAYPLRILIWHEIVNDVVADRPVAVTYCPLCNSAVVFDRRVAGRTLDFGTTGKLRHSDLVMYDRATESWWQQFTGDAIVGQLMGETLEMLPARLESFAEFKARHGGGEVLVPNNPNLRRYGENPYVGYDSAGRPFLYQGEMPEGINPMARVVAVGKGSEPFAVALALVRKKGEIDINGVRFAWRAGQNSALDSRAIDAGRDVGTVVATVDDGEDGRRDVPYDVTFAFAFHAFHPKGTIRME